MAETLHIDPGTEAVTLSKSRHPVCFEAGWEIEALALVLPDLLQVDANDSDNGRAGLVMRGVAARLNERVNALQAGLFDPAVTVRQLQRRVLLELDKAPSACRLISTYSAVAGSATVLQPAWMLGF